MAEIFRHYRPKQFDDTRLTIMPQKNGGVTFMLRPTGEKTYDFWIYICPLDAEFSSRAAVNRLREVADKGVSPWGNITLDGSPLTEQLVDAARKSVFPSEVGKLLLRIERTQRVAQLNLQSAAPKSAVEFYQEN